MVLTLYKLDPSPPVRAVFMTMEILGIDDVEMIDVNLLTNDHLKEEFTQINPQHTVPTLIDDDFIIWDSHAITTYLVNKYAENHFMYPTDPKARALIDQKLHFDSGILFPALRTNVVPVIYKGEKSFKPENLAKIKAAYDFTNKFLAKTPWLAGDEMTLADICCVATISSMNVVLPIDEALHPNIAAWLKRFATKDFYKKHNEINVEKLRALIKSKLA